MNSVYTCTVFRVLSRGFEGWKLPLQKSCGHSGHSMLCLKIINILMHQIAPQHISTSKKFGRKILDRTLVLLFKQSVIVSYQKLGLTPMLRPTSKYSLPIYAPGKA